MLRKITSHILSITILTLMLSSIAHATPPLHELAYPSVASINHATPPLHELVHPSVASINHATPPLHELVHPSVVSINHATKLHAAINWGWFVAALLGGAAATFVTYLILQTAPWVGVWLSRILAFIISSLLGMLVSDIVSRNYNAAINLIKNAINRFVPWWARV